MPSPSSLPPSSILFSPLSFFCSQKVNNQFSTWITPFPVAYPEPTWQPPCSSTVPSPSMSAKVYLLTETILSLEALLKKRTLMLPLSQLLPPPQPSYHQADPHLPDLLPYPTSYVDVVPSYLPLGWPLPPLPTMFTPYWEQLPNGTVGVVYFLQLKAPTLPLSRHPHYYPFILSPPS